MVTFENFKDRDEVLRKVTTIAQKNYFSHISLLQARMLKKANIHVEEDLSKRTRENRTELRKFMRQVIMKEFIRKLSFQVRKANPEKNCFLQYDKLYIG